VKTGLPTLSTDVWAAPTPVEFTEKMLGDAMAAAYADGAEPTRLVVPYNIKRGLVMFKGRESTQVLVGKTEVVATVDVIATDGGRVTAMPSRWLPADMGMLIDPEYARLAFFRNFRQYPIAKIGDAESRMIVVEWGTQVDSAMAHIIFNGITPTVTPVALRGGWLCRCERPGQRPRTPSRRVSPRRTPSGSRSSARSSVKRSRCTANQHRRCTMPERKFTYMDGSGMRRTLVWDEDDPTWFGVFAQANMRTLPG
jgi:hypothetical protein